MNVFDQLVIEDGKLLKDLPPGDDYWKSLEIYQKRLILYKQFAESQTDSIIKELIYTKREVIINQFAIIQARNDMLSDIAKIFSRLDNLEDSQSSKT